jgi:hypothetical protein
MFAVSALALATHVILATDAFPPPTVPSIRVTGPIASVPLSAPLECPPDRMILVEISDDPRTFITNDIGLGRRSKTANGQNYYTSVTILKGKIDDKTAYLTWINHSLATNASPRLPRLSGEIGELPVRIVKWGSRPPVWDPGILVAFEPGQPDGESRWKLVACY